MNKKIIVIGSSNTDLVVQSERLPKAGETIIGTSFFQNQGGKGANQAVAASRLGGDVTFVANVGNDAFGRNAITSYQEAGIDVNYIQLVGVPTGMAMINVDANAENCIVVVPGANNTLSKKNIDAIEKQLDENSIVLLQLEVPIQTVEYAILEAKNNGSTVILNPAPAQSIKEEVLTKVDIITPNETELELLTKIKVIDESTMLKAVNILHAKGIDTVIVTLGSKGCFVSTSTIKEYFSAPKVEAVDTTGAGDVFNGALTAHLSKGQSFEDTIQFALKAASKSVTKAGAQESIPLLSEL
ncbi:ribokinase [Flammeovirga sp. SJP92]|uniref:ribokinase n=1 Tax=Flammeovirga sp. SJP92 TaxID=1775430 RepID=UPI000786EA81|nr:ribokinase [Flammeovirga sp. SJP92]KXX70981.1 ribokinase [Flammeovirga sp. SJP92]